MTGVALAMLGVVAALGQAEGRATPNSAAVQEARMEQLNGSCGDPDICNHPSYAYVRRVNCTPRAANRARCRFEERIEQFYVRHPRWQRAEYDFVYGAARSRWAMDCRAEAAQSPSVSIIRCN